MPKRKVTYYCPTCFDDYSEDLVKLEMFKSKKRNLYRCEVCEETLEEDEVYSKKTIIEELNKQIFDLKQEQVEAKDEYLEVVMCSEEDIALIEKQIKELD